MYLNEQRFEESSGNAVRIAVKTAKHDVLQYDFRDKQAVVVWGTSVGLNGRHIMKHLSGITLKIIYIQVMMRLMVSSGRMEVHF